MELDKLVSAIVNDLEAGLSGMTNQPNLPWEQLRDEVIEVREVIIKELVQKKAIDRRDIAMALNCVEIDCEDMNKCPCKAVPGKHQAHFEIPQLLPDLGDDAVLFVGSTDRSRRFKVYFTPQAADLHAFKRRGGSTPYVYIERTPNANGKFDCWLFNAPFAKTISVIAIFKDPRELAEYNCCSEVDYTDMGIISSEIKNRIVKQKLQLYRQYLQPPHQTDFIAR